MLADSARPVRFAPAALRAGWMPVAVALAMGLAGCKPAREATYAPGTGAVGAAAPRSGGHAVFCREEDPDYLDPALSYGTYTAPIVEGVFRGAARVRGRARHRGRAARARAGRRRSRRARGRHAVRVLRARRCALRRAAPPPHHRRRLQVRVRAAIPAGRAGRAASIANVVGAHAMLDQKATRDRRRDRARRLALLPARAPGPDLPRRCSR